MNRYYINQLKELTWDNEQCLLVKFNGTNGTTTNWMNLDENSLPTIITVLTKYLEHLQGVKATKLNEGN